MIQHKNLLTDKQKQQIQAALQSGGEVIVRPSVKQQGGFLGSLLASIGIPLALQLFKKMTGKGAPRMGKYKGKGAPRMGKYQGKDPQESDLNLLLPLLAHGKIKEAWAKKNQQKRRDAARPTSRPAAFS